MELEPANLQTAIYFRFLKTFMRGTKWRLQVLYKRYTCSVMDVLLGSCTNEFTLTQVARMHCYIDRFYQTWQPNPVAPSAIPLPPRILDAKDNKVIINYSFVFIYFETFIFLCVGKKLLCLLYCHSFNNQHPL